MKLMVNEETPEANAERIVSELDSEIYVKRDGRALSGPTLQEVFLATAEQAEEALPHARRVLLDSAIEDAVVLLTAGADESSYGRKRALAVAAELRRHQSACWNATQARRRAEAAEAARHTPRPTKRVELIRDNEGRVVAADVWGS